LGLALATQKAANREIGAPRTKPDPARAHVVVLRETHETPPLVADRLLHAGGVNRFGEPNYRAIWGWNRLAWIGGKFEDRDGDGHLLREVVELRREPKYPAVNRWHIERWMPPESYGSPRQWYVQTVERENGVSIPALGPYPYRGDYEHCFTLQNARGEFVQLTAAAAEHIARAIEWCHKAPRAVGNRAVRDRSAREEQNYDQWAYDVLDDSVPAFHQQPFVTVV
jgi:hypothetical protein